jgi:hypothetical protein
LINTGGLPAENPGENNPGKKPWKPLNRKPQFLGKLLGIAGIILEKNLRNSPGE